MDIDEIDLSTWAGALPATGHEVFHRPEALEVVAAHAPGEMRLYGGFKGQQPVGLVPVFERTNTLGTAVISPPPSLGIPRLGPLVFPQSPKRRKRESVTREFVELVLEALAVDSARTFLRFECALDFDDPRPFAWNGLSVEQSFTYVLDLEEATRDSVKAAFSKSLRRELRDLAETDVEVTLEGADAAEEVHADVASHYEAQEEPFPPSAAYFRELVEAMGEHARVYVARDGTGAYLGGIIALYSNDVAAFWQGGIGRDHEGASVNTALHWAIITDIIDGPPVEGVCGYDLVGANTPRLCRYKSKFGAELVGYPVVESTGVGMRAAKRAYSLLQR